MFFLSTTTTRVARREIDRSINQLALGSAQLPPPALAEALQAHGHVFAYQKPRPDNKLQGLRVEWFNRHIATHGGQMPGEYLRNLDGSSDFYAYRFDGLPPEFVVARHRSAPAGGDRPAGTPGT